MHFHVSWWEGSKQRQVTEERFWGEIWEHMAVVVKNRVTEWGIPWKMGT